MKHIFLNLKRFDVPGEYGGVNRLAPIDEWGAYIVRSTQEALRRYRPDEVEFVQYFPEAHLIGAVSARSDGSPVQIGCQGVYRMSTAAGGNFGAFTTNRPVSAMRALGVRSVLIGHCEERMDKLGILAEAGAADTVAVSRILNQEVREAIAGGLSVLYCIGEDTADQERWQEVLEEQLEVGLRGVERSRITIGYEPIWSIGPGKRPADQAYITKVARFIKEKTGGMPVVYGGGLREDNAEMLSSIAEIDGGLIALTRFQGEVGFYPDEYIKIIRAYLGK